MLRDVVKAANPITATVVGDFSPRGGLGTIVTATLEPRNVESAELIAILREVQDRVRARNPETAAGTGIPLPDLMPLVHARDAALGKVAAIGTVNPRPGGLVNSLVQGWKKFVARVLDWHVREQVEFNRKMVACIDSAIEALTETQSRDQQDRRAGRRVGGDPQGLGGLAARSGSASSSRPRSSSCAARRICRARFSIA